MIGEEVRQERNSRDREETKASAFISGSPLKTSEAQLGHPWESVEDTSALPQLRGEKKGQSSFNAPQLPVQPRAKP